jgi:hypothetical protein
MMLKDDVEIFINGHKIEPLKETEFSINILK